MSRLNLKDAFVLDGVHRSESGYLAAHAKVARTGIQVYHGSEVGKPDQDRVKLYRPEEEVFHRDAMHSMAHRPVTLTHPPVMVDSKNWKKYAKGQTGDEIVRDGDCVRVPVTLMDQATIDAYESGDSCELSMGYTTDIDWTAGTTPQGDAYDGVQRNIRANHLAFVPQARGGEKLRFGDADIADREWSAEERSEAEKKGHAMAGGKFPIESAADVKSAVTLSGKGGPAVKAFIIKRAKAIGAEGELPDDWKQSSQTKDGDVLPPTPRKHKMPITAAFDGVTVEFADELSASNMNTAFSTIKAKLKDAEKKMAECDDDAIEKEKAREDKERGANDALAAKDGEIAVLKKALEDAKVTPAALDAMLRDRETVKDAAKKVLPSTFAFDGKSVADIKLAAVSAKLGDAAVKDMPEAAVAGAFVALTTAAATGGASRLADALSHPGRAVVANDRHAEGVRLRDEAHALMVHRLTNPKAYDKDGRKIV